MGRPKGRPFSCHDSSAAFPLNYAETRYARFINQQFELDSIELVIGQADWRRNRLTIGAAVLPYDNIAVAYSGLFGSGLSCRYVRLG